VNPLRGLLDAGLRPGVDFCEHAVELSGRGRLVSTRHISQCPVCLRRWRVTEAELQPWMPMEHEQAVRAVLNMAAVFALDERDERYRPFYAHLARCPECERRLADLTSGIALVTRQPAGLNL
jgi:hypothetical protein